MHILYRSMGRYESTACYLSYQSYQTEPYASPEMEKRKKWLHLTPEMEKSNILNNKSEGLIGNEKI